MMEREETRNLETIPVGSLGIIPLRGCESLAQRVDQYLVCLLYTSDAADDLLCVALGGPRITKKKTKKKTTKTPSMVSQQKI